MSTPSPLNVFLTGRLTVEGPEGSFDEGALPGNQARVALAALVHERVPLDRDRLADIVWGDDLPDGWSGSLSALISRTRSLFARCGLDPKSILISTAGSYAITLPPGSWVDLEDAIRRLDRAEAEVRHGNSSGAGYRLLIEAELARGDSIAALEAFGRCERIVRAEFGASPSQLTLDAAERARRP